MKTFHLLSLLAGPLLLSGCVATLTPGGELYTDLWEPEPVVVPAAPVVVHEPVVVSTPPVVVHTPPVVVHQPAKPPHRPQPNIHRPRVHNGPLALGKTHRPANLASNGGGAKSGHSNPGGAKPGGSGPTHKPGGTHGPGKPR